MTIKEKLLQEVDIFPESLLVETLDFVLFLKSRYLDTEISSEEQDIIAASQSAYNLGDYINLDQYEANQV
ncbi:DUF2281 domain-containing protein [Pseudanabaena biceps]|nr:DUF2281 domain-containing protein [Pseudanabaena biceps]